MAEGTYARMKRSALEPIDPKIKTELNKLIAKARPLVKNYHTNVYKLGLILKQVDTTYGDNNVGKWAHALDLDLRTVYRWRIWARSLTPEWVAKWADKITISKAAVLVQHFGGLDKVPDEVMEMAASLPNSIALAGYLIEAHSIHDEETDMLKEEAKYKIKEFSEKLNLPQFEEYELMELAESKPKLAARITEEIQDVDQYREFRRREDIKEQQRLEVYVERKAIPFIKRFLQKLEKDADTIREAIKKQADPRELRRLLDDIDKLIAELLAIIPEVLPQDAPRQELPTPDDLNTLEPQPKPAKVTPIKKAAATKAPAKATKRAPKKA